MSQSRHRRRLAGPFSSRFRGVLLTLAAIVASLLSGGDPLSAQPAKKPQVVSAQVGFDGQYKFGCWTPISVTLRGGSSQLSGDLQVVLPDGDGVPYRVSSPRLLLLPGAEQTVSLFVKFGSRDSRIEVVFRPDEGDNFSRTFNTYGDGDDDSLPPPLERDRELVLAVGPATGIEEVIRRRNTEPDESPGVAQIIDASTLPRRWYGYDGVDIVVLSGSKPEPYEKLAADSPQMAALDEWVRRGGRLIITAGAQAAGLFAPNLDPASEDARQRAEPFTRFAPGRFSGLAQLRDASAWEVYVGSQEPVAELTNPLATPRFTDVAGRIEAAAGDVPVVIRSAHGLGEVVYFAGEFDRAPFSDWRGRRTFLERIVAVSQSDADSTEIGAGAGNVLGSEHRDLAGPLLASLDQFEGVQPVHFSLVALLVCVYILLIGPGDYFFLKHVLRRMEYTWITFPMIVLIVSGGAYLLANWLKGDQLRLNQLDVVDVDTTTGLTRGTTWLNVFSPRMDYYDVSAQPQLPGGQRPAVSDLQMSWLSSPDAGVTNMDLASGRLQASRAYAFKPDLSAISDVPIQVWSTKSFQVNWTHKSDAGAGQPAVTSDLQSTTAHDLRGSVTSHLNVGLEDCLLVYGLARDQGAEAWAYAIGKVEPGATVMLGFSQARAPEKLKNIFTQPELVDEGKGRYRQEIRPYEAQNADPEKHLRLMLFYDVVGGRGYTRLLNHHQSRLDMSRQIRAGRAILYGRSQLPGVIVNRDGQALAGTDDRHWTFYRFVVDVKPMSGP